MEGGGCRAGPSVHQWCERAAVGPAAVGEVLRARWPSSLKPLLAINQLG